MDVRPNRRLVYTGVTRGLVGRSVASLRLLSCEPVLVKETVARMCEGVNRVHDLKSMVTEYWEVTVNRKSVREYAKRQRVGCRLS